MKKKQPNKVILSLGISFILYTLYVIIKGLKISNSFIVIISLLSFIVSFFELSNCIADYLFKKSESLQIFFEKNMKKHCNKKIIRMFEKEKRHFELMKKFFVINEVLLYVFVFWGLLVISTKEIPEQLVECSNYYSIISFGLLFISIYCKQRISEKEYIDEKKIERYKRIIKKISKTDE